MKRIIIKSMHILNFKGVRDLNIDFDAHETDILGCNGSGKTTIADAFTWLLFGKDSQFRTEFDLKTLDADGKIIYKLPHEVSAIINVDGEDISLCRRLVEKWPKRNGEPTFTGNTVERVFNDVPCNEKEFNAKIAEICDEDTFKKITSPTFFVSQTADKQKSDLMRMAGEIIDDDIAAGNADFVELIERLKSGKKSIDELKREISSKKSIVNAELKTLPGNIEEKKRDIAAHTDDWDAIEKEIEEVTSERDSIDTQLTDITAAGQKYAAERREKWDVIERQRIDIAIRRREVADTARADYNASRQTLQRIDSDIVIENHQIQSLERSIESDRAEIQRLNDRRARLLTEYKSLNARRAEIEAETIVFNENDFVCPTCHRSFDVADIESKQAEMTERFNADKAKRLERIAADIAANMASGSPIKGQIATIEANIAASQTKIATHNARIAELDDERAKVADIAEPDVEPIIAADKHIIAMTAELDELIAAYESDAQPESGTDTADLKSHRAVLNIQLDQLKSRLAHRSTLNNDNKRLAELESQYRTLNDELTELERLEYIIGEFSKAKNETIDARINGMFNVVRFRWIKYRINGEERETCEATINGVPYSSLNTAGRIAAGIDIINAICKFEGICAPIVIDNRESVSEIPPVESQIVNLIVSDDEHITARPHKSTPILTA